MSRKPFTALEHLGAGAILERVSENLRGVGVAVCSAYGVAASDKILRIVKRLADIRSEMDNHACREIRGSGLEGDIPVTAFYYGWQNGPGSYPPSGDRRQWLASTAETALPEARKKWQRRDPEAA